MFKLALTYPDRYAAAASLSGALEVVALAQAAAETGAEDMQHIFGEVGAVAGSPHDLFYLARQLGARSGPRPRLYQWCGTEDFFYAGNVRFREHAEALGLGVEYEEGTGGHEWACWDAQIQRVLAWLLG